MRNETKKEQLDTLSKEALEIEAMIHGEGVGKKSTIKKTNKEFDHNPSFKGSNELVDKLKKESETDYKDGLDPDLKTIRKLRSYTLSEETISDIEKFSKDKRLKMNMFLETLVEDYGNESRNGVTVSNSAGPINLPIDEIAKSVADIIGKKREPINKESLELNTLKTRFDIFSTFILREDISPEWGLKNIMGLSQKEIDEMKKKSS